MRSLGPLRVLGFLLAGLVVSIGVVTMPDDVPWSILLPLAVFAGIVLSPGELLIVYVGYVALLGWTGWQAAAERGDILSAFVILVAVMAPMLWLATSRALVGLRGGGGEAMLVDLRDRLRANGELPVLPRGWQAEGTVQSAYGDSFSGDFIVANLSTEGRTLEIALVDVSGKGAQAGTRSLLVSGGLSGLLGAMEPAAFLEAANAYLLRQRWLEGFATAVHVAIDLDSGGYSVGSAGPPAAITYRSGSGRWAVLDEVSGPLLGVIEGATFPRITGVLARGDALVLYTDGVIESRHGDLAIGVDRMLGLAEKLATKGFSGGASRLCEAARAGETDDRAVILVWRD